MSIDQNEYRPAEVAQLFQIHPNTVRLYEELGFITPANRNPRNNYREFTEMHINQIKICRCIFGHPFTSQSIRKVGKEVMYTSAQRQWGMLESKAEAYLKAIEAEIAMARKTADLLLSWADPKSTVLAPVELVFSRKGLADYFGVTVETIRNWERNALITPVEKGKQGEVMYASSDFERISVIYMLLQAGYSMAAIQRSISMYDQGHGERILSALNEPLYEEIVSAGDNWLNELLKILETAQPILQAVDKLIR